MCVRETNLVRTKVNNKGRTITCYKILAVRLSETPIKGRYRKELLSPFNVYYPSRGDYLWCPGRNGSDVPSNHKYDDNKPRGIHVFLYKKDTPQLVEWFKRQMNKVAFVVVPVICKTEHLIAAGENYDDFQEAVFSEVYLKKTDYIKALKTKIKKG